jgi:hypothetical protein
VGEAADAIFEIVKRLESANPTPNPTEFFGTAEGEKCLLHGEWRLLFTTAADATFSKNSSRGDAQASNVVDAVRGKVGHTYIIMVMVTVTMIGVTVTVKSRRARARELAWSQAWCGRAGASFAMHTKVPSQPLPSTSPSPPSLACTLNLCRRCVAP